MLAVKSRNNELINTIINAPVAANPFYKDILGRDARAYAIEMNNYSAMEQLSSSQKQWIEALPNAK